MTLTSDRLIGCVYHNTGCRTKTVRLSEAQRMLDEFYHCGRGESATDPKMNLTHVDIYEGTARMWFSDKGTGSYEFIFEPEYTPECDG